MYNIQIRSNQKQDPIIMGRVRLEKTNPISQHSTRKELDRKKIYREIGNELEDMENLERGSSD